MLYNHTPRPRCVPVWAVITIFFTYYYWIKISWPKSVVRLIRLILFHFDMDTTDRSINYYDIDAIQLIGVEYEGL